METAPLVDAEFLALPFFIICLCLSVPACSASGVSSTAEERIVGLERLVARKDAVERQLREQVYVFTAQLSRCEGATHNSSARATGLAVLNCEGIGFDPRWSAFQARFVQEISPPIPDTVQIPYPSDELASFAAEMLEKCEPSVLDFMVGWDRFYWDATTDSGMPKVAGASQQHDWWVDAGVPDPGSGLKSDSSSPEILCLYGCVAAEWLVALAILKVDASEGTTRDVALQRLHFAEGMLGRGGVLDFTSSSHWATSRRPLASVLEQLEPAGVLPGHAQSFGVSNAVPSALELARRLQPCDPVLDHGCWRQSLVLPASNFQNAEKTNALPHMVVNVMGGHAPFCHDVAMSVEAGAQALNIDLQLVYVGQFYLCQVVSSGCDQDAAKSWLRSWVERWEVGNVGAPNAEADALHAAMRGHPHARIESADLHICVGHAVYCWLLRRRATERARLSSIPALHILDMEFNQNVPLAWRQEMMADFRDWWTDRDSRVDVFASCMEALSLQMQWQMGVFIPFVPTVGLAVRTAAVYNPPNAQTGEERSVVVLRSAFYRLPGGRVFSALLERLAAQNYATHQTRFNWMASFTGGALSTRREQGSWQSFEAMAQHTCALYVPAEISQIKFRDAYSMGLPMIAPQDLWMLRLLRDMYAKWGQLHSEYGDRLDPTFASSRDAREADKVQGFTSAWPHEPFYDQKNSPARLEYWFPLADHLRYPHSVKFESLPDLLDVVANTAWREVSVKMRGHFLRVLANVDSFYRESLASLLAPSLASAPAFY